MATLSSTISVEIDDDGRSVRALAFATHSDYIVSGDEERVRVRRVDDGKETAMIVGDTASRILCLAVSSDGKWIAAGTVFNQVFLWDAKTFEKVFDRWEPYNILAVDFSPDSTTLLVTSRSAATIFVVASPRSVRLGPLRHETPLRAAKYSPTGDRIATAADHSVRLWSSNDGQLLMEVKVTVPAELNTGLLWVNYDHLLVVSGNEMQIVETSKGSRAHATRVQDSSRMTLLRHAEFLAYSQDRTITFRRKATNAQQARIEHPESIYSMVHSSDELSIATGGTNGKVVLTDLSRTSHLDYFFRELDIDIDSTVLDFWMYDQLEEGEASLTAAISTSPSHHLSACRALLRTRLQNWDAAILDAEKSIEIQPSFIGYVSKSIALSKKGGKYEVYRTCDLAFQHLHSMGVSFLLLVKAIVVFLVGEHEDAVTRVEDLVLATVTDPFNLSYRMVQAYMCLSIGNLHMASRNYEGAVKAFKRAQLRNYVWSSQLTVISLLFGWRFEGLDITIRQRLCEALHSSGRTQNAAESLLEMVNTFAEEVQAKGPLTEWVSGFAHQCLSTPHWGRETVKEDGSNEVPLSHHDTGITFNPTAQMVLREWSKSTLAFRSWNDSLASSHHFMLPKSLVYNYICECLEALGRIMEATECFCQMMDDLAKEIKGQGQDEQMEWMSGFTQRCSGKLMDLGDAVTSVDDAIVHYTAAFKLALNPAAPAAQRAILIKRSKAYLTRGSWKEALADAEEVIMLDQSSPEGYEMKHAALHGAGDYGKAIEAFEVMLSRISRSPDIEIYENLPKYVTPAQTMKAIRGKVQDTIRDSPRVLINTLTGRLCDKSEQAAAFESLPVFKELISSMTTCIDHERIEKAVRKYYRYATLSHRWEDNEPLFDKVIHVAVYNLDESFTHDKLRMFCKVVRDSGFDWAWSDTCCIDKKDHVVLQEAIVAMFKWYEGSSLTVIFLRGVRSPSQRGDLVKSVWNSRAWTFQEYHASKVVRFYTEDWKPYMNLNVPNHKECPEIILEMEEATRISAQDLMSMRPGLDNIRTKLCLASQRQTSLVEDAAYSLFGIFSISLPVVYGEGDKALGKLLAQVLASSGDTSILAWIGKSGSFNSCLPANISVFGRLSETHIPQVMDSTEMDKVTATDPGRALVMKLYGLLCDLPVASFTGNRMKLPCIIFKLGTFKLGPATSHRKHVFRARTTALGMVEIETSENLSKFNTLYLIYPWIDYLLDQRVVTTILETVVEKPGDLDSLSSSTSVLLSSPGPSTAPKPSGATKPAVQPWSPSNEQRPTTSDLEPSTESLETPTSSLQPPSTVSVTDKQMRAFRAIAQLKQPFRALLVAPNPDCVAAYKRIATESLITVQMVKDITPEVLEKLIKGVRTLDIL